MSSSVPHLLLVDALTEDRRLARMLLAAALPAAVIEEIGDGIALARALHGPAPTALVTELRLPWGDGVDLLATVRERWPDVAVVLLAREADAAELSRAIAAGIDGYESKSSGGLLRLAKTVGEAIERRAGRAGERSLLGELDAMPVGLLTMSGEGVVLAASRPAGRLLGVAPATLPGLRLASLLPPAAATRVQALLAGEAGTDVELRLEGADGEPRWVRLIGWRSGATWHATLEDVSAYRRRESVLAERARSGAEAQEFAYAISHDLQEPLHIVASYARLLEERAAAALDEQSRVHLAHVGRAAARMQEMIDALLDYARVETRGRDLSPVDLEQVLTRALDTLRPALTACGGEVISAGLPIVDGDPAQLAQLLQNLLGNAIKFRGQAAPRIHVSAEEGAGEWRLAVRDNGIGIPADGLERIFGMFQRLHTTAEVPGTGMGLAICRRIAERHGGRIWASAAPGGGAVFFVTFPKHPRSANDTTPEVIREAEPADAPAAG